jgi:hypothetical protein
VKGHSTRLEQVENRISKLWDKIEIKEKKTEKILIKQLKSCKKNMQELSDSIKKPNWESWALKEKRCKSKGYMIYSIK